MKVLMYVDPYATMDREPEDEYKDIEKRLRKIFPLRCKFIFKRNVLPFKLANEIFDIYVMDIGGLCYVDHSGEQRWDLSKELCRQVIDHPNSLFLIWSSFTSRDFWDAVDEEYPELKSCKNVLDMEGRGCADNPDRDILNLKIKNWANA